MITIQITRNFKDIKVDAAKLKKMVKHICNRFEVSDATISIAIIDNIEIRKINKKFLNHDYVTDCISFDLSDSEPKSKTENKKTFELIVNGQRATEQANMRGHSAKAELALYITHGLLHNFGFDDSTDKPAEKMHKTEDEILRQFGFGSVYNKNSV